MHPYHHAIIDLASNNTTQYDYINCVLQVHFSINTSTLNQLTIHVNGNYITHNSIVCQFLASSFCNLNVFVTKRFKNFTFADQVFLTVRDSINVPKFFNNQS